MPIIAHEPARFANLPDYPFAQNWLTIDLGEGLSARMRYLDEGPKDGLPVLLFHGEPLPEHDPVAGGGRVVLSGLGQTRGAACQPHAILTRCGHFSQEDRPAELVRGVVRMAKLVGVLT